MIFNNRILKNSKKKEIIKMKTIYLILIISLIFFSNCTASCTGKIVQDIIKKSVATTKKSQSQ
jgi:hypothetical protein